MRYFASGATRMAELTDMIVDQIRKLAELRKEGNGRRVKLISDTIADITTGSRFEELRR